VGSANGLDTNSHFLINSYFVVSNDTLNGVKLEMLKTLRLVSGIAVFFGLTVWALAQEKQVTTDPPSPKLILDSAVHDFGTVEAGMPLRYTFKIKNEGTADLLIQNVAPS
jgi:hypothetical protein